jgi:two-component system chemotaxis response regulator CheY
MRILVVEDSKAMRSVLKRTVQGAGYADLTIDEACNGAEALAAMRAAPPDLVLTDWNMPGMGGIEFLEALRAEGSPVRVGLVTSEQNPAILQRGTCAGALFVVGKPFTADVLQAALAKAGQGGFRAGSAASRGEAPVATRERGDRGLRAVGRAAGAARPARSRGSRGPRRAG